MPEPAIARDLALSGLHRARRLRNGARRASRRSVRYLGMAYADASEAIRGERDPMVPPRRYDWPGRAPKLGRQIVEHALIDAAALQPQERVLDIGCGPGRNAVHLTRYLEDGSYEGFDVIPEAIQWAQRRITPRHPAFGFQLLDLRNQSYNPDGAQSAAEVRFPYPDDAFDVAFATSVYTHMLPYETEHYLRESARVLGPEGRVASTFFLINEGSERALAVGIPRSRLPGGLMHMEHEFTDPRGGRYRTPHAVGHERMLALYEEDAVAMHERAGFEVQEVRYGFWARDRIGVGLGQDLIVARAS